MERRRNRVVGTGLTLAMTSLLLGALACDSEPAYRNDSCMADGNALVTVGADNRELGFDASEAVAFFAGGTGNLVWHDGATTTVTVGAELTGDSVAIYRWPPGKGYCKPTMTLPASLRLTTADGKLDESWSGSLVGVSDGAGLAAVFPNAPMPFSARVEAVVPAAWRTAAYVEVVDVNIEAKQNHFRVSCATNQTVSTDPADHCNDRDGVLRFFTRDSNAQGPSDAFVIATWLWSD